MIIYKITNIINDKCYIGQTCEPLKQRYNRHMGYQSRENDTKFYRAVRKYGKEAFVIEQIDSANSQDELDDKEIYWINKFDSCKNGYNTKDDKGKCGGDTLTNNPNLLEIKQKISKSKLGSKNPQSVKVKSIDLITNEIKKFDSMIECQQHYGIERHDIISRRCRGIIKKPYNNRLIFEYID